MLIVADENIPLLEPFFGDIGEIRRVSGRNLSMQSVQHADVLLVRSVTRVGRELLEGSQVRFVGTATIGTDHIDQDWLAQQGICFASAPGCNANSVAEYVLSVLSLYAEKRGLSNWSHMSVGIVGVGNVGQTLARKLRLLGFEVHLCDPPRVDSEECGAEQFVSLDRVLKCDVVTLHTPLTKDQRHATYHLLGEEQLAVLDSGQLLINAGRGEVIDANALQARLEKPDAPTVVLDVWEQEPGISSELANRVWLATPHIAGYSLEGKVRGTEMIYQALNRHLGVSTQKKVSHFLPEPALGAISFTGAVEEHDALRIALRACYDPRDDDMRLRASMTGPLEQRALEFDRLRKNYRVRRECSSLRVELDGTNKSLEEKLRSVGFKLKR